MDTVKKVEILIREVPNTTQRVIWGAEPQETTLLVVSYDTDAVRRINRQREDDFGKKEQLICPARYAALWHEGREDIGIIGQSLIMSQKYRDEAVWFEGFRDLPFAVEELRKKFPEKTIPDSVTCLIDWPVNRKKLSPGATLVSHETIAPEKV